MKAGALQAMGKLDSTCAGFNFYSPTTVTCSYPVDSFEPSGGAASPDVV
jgi:hypothetical protein